MASISFELKNKTVKAIIQNTILLNRSGDKKFALSEVAP